MFSKEEPEVGEIETAVMWYLIMERKWWHWIVVKKSVNRRHGE